MAFRVGQSVVFVGGIEWDALCFFFEALPQLRHVYTIREIMMSPNGPALRLREIINEKLPYSNGFLECAFIAVAFRPVVDTTKEVEALKKIIIDAMAGRKLEAVR